MHLLGDRKSKLAALACASQGDISLLGDSEACVICIYVSCIPIYISQVASLINVSRYLSQD